MGVVYEGFDPLIARVVALKTIRSDQLAVDDAAGLVARFRNEAQAAGRLSHPNIVSIYEFGEDDGVWFIAMELVKGRELKEFFDAGERFTTADTVRIMTQILAALAYSHRQGVVHRDIKPANIFLLPDGTVKVADFGIAHIESSELTQLGTVLGTPNYMSPEQILGLPVDGRADLFAAGVILYQFLTGERPFTGSATTTVQKVLKEDPLPPSILNVQVLPAFDAVVRRALAKRPDDRFANADEFAAALRAAAAAESAVGTDETVAIGANDLRLAAARATDAERQCPRRELRRARSPGHHRPRPGRGEPLPSRSPPASRPSSSAPDSGSCCRVAPGEPAKTIAGSVAPAATVAAGTPRPVAAAPAIIARTGGSAGVGARHDADLGGRRDRSRRSSLSQRRGRGKCGCARPRRTSWSKRRSRSLSTPTRSPGTTTRSTIACCRGAAASSRVSFRESEPRVGKDGLLTVTTEAMVDVKALQKAVNEMSRDERIGFIRARGDPRISVRILVRADGAPDAPSRPSPIAENIIKAEIKSFGFRTWSDDEPAAGRGATSADFAVTGEVTLAQAVDAPRSVGAGDHQVRGHVRDREVHRSRDGRGDLPQHDAAQGRRQRAERGRGAEGDRHADGQGVFARLLSGAPRDRRAAGRARGGWRARYRDRRPARARARGTAGGDHDCAARAVGSPDLRHRARRRRVRSASALPEPY